METETLTCNSCGAPLEVPSSANFVTCRHCSSQLAIRRTESTTFTEQLNHLVEKTEQLSSQIDDLTAQNELAALDREWELNREDFMVSGKDGQKSIPSTASAVVGSILFVIFGCFWISMTTGISQGFAPGVAPINASRVALQLVGVLIIIAGIAGGIVGCSKATRYRDAERRYQRLRSELKQRISNGEQSP